MNITDAITVTVILVLGSVLVSAVIWYIHSPFRYPYKYIELNISGKRSLNADDLIDKYLIEHRNTAILKQKQTVDNWKADCEKTIGKSLYKKRRRSQFEKAVDDNRMFCFILVRAQTRYKQRNYVKQSYRVLAEQERHYIGYEEISWRYEQLKKLGFECTLAEHSSGEQRKLMSKKLREEIAARDNYTCRICGKYMPDGVGLHIDHIIPIAKGGKSVPSNLQVLCSKCNGTKSKN